MRPVVIDAAAPALAAIGEALRDPSAEVGEETLDALRSYLRDGADSPLFGSDPVEARHAAKAIRDRLLATPDTRPQVHATAA